MGNRDYKSIFHTHYKNEQRIKKLCPKATRQSGIYCFHRINESGFKFAYVGLATKDLLNRLAQHLEGFDQHIDKSIRKHKLYDESPYGYQIDILCYCSPEECSEKEKFYIKKVADAGWQMRNTELGGLENKGDLNDRKEGRGYHDGLKQGYTNAQKKVANWFEKSLDYSIKGNPNVNKQKAYDRFTDFLKVDKKEDIEDNNSGEDN